MLKPELLAGKPNNQRCEQPGGKEHMKRIAQILMVVLSLAATAMGGSLNNDTIAAGPNGCFSWTPTDFDPPGWRLFHQGNPGEEN